MKSSEPEERSYALGVPVNRPPSGPKLTPIEGRPNWWRDSAGAEKYIEPPWPVVDDYAPMCVPYMAEDGTIQPVTEELILRLCGDEFNTGGYYDGAEWVPLEVWE